MVQPLGGSRTTDPKSFVKWVYIFVTIICVYLSGYATYVGFESFFNENTWAVTAVVVLVLVACDWEILRRRQAGDKLGPIIAVLIGVTAASWAANFTTFYGNFIGKQLAIDGYDRAARLYRDDLAKIRAHVVPLNDAERHITAVRTALKDLRGEAGGSSGSGRVGCGDEVRTNLTNLRAALSRLPEEIRPRIPEPSVPCQRFIQLVVESVNGALVNYGNALPASRPRKFIEDAEKIEAEETARLAGSKSASDKLRKEHQAGIGKLDRAMTELAARVSESLTAATGRLDADKLNIAAYRQILEQTNVWSITNALRSGFADRLDVKVTVAASLAALFVDLMPLMFALAFVGGATGNGMRRIGDIFNRQR